MDAALLGRRPWLQAPIVNRHTRPAANINPARGQLTVQGWEQDGPVTAPLPLEST
jgi:hypothetical protein